MDVSVAINTRIELREYADETVDSETKYAFLEAGRLAPSGKNLQHWRFVLIDDENDLRELAENAPTAGWVANADFAICTDPRRSFNEIDAGRTATHMQLTAWERDVSSCMFTVDRSSSKNYSTYPTNTTSRHSSLRLSWP